MIADCLAINYRAYAVRECDYSQRYFVFALYEGKIHKRMIETYHAAAGEKALETGDRLTRGINWQS